MKGAAYAAVAAGVLCWAPAATARTADYSLTEAEFKADADILKVAEFPAWPDRGDVEISVEDAAKLDIQLMILGIACRAWKVENPLSRMVVRTLESWDRNGKLGSGEGQRLLRVRFESASATMRCVEVAELKSRCIARTAIKGSATFEDAGKSPRTEIFAVEAEHQQSDGGCGVARGTALSGRSASIALIGKLNAMAAGR